jgi:hypothetical protein
MRLCKYLFALLCVPCLCWGQPQNAVLDNFNRSNQSPIAGNWVNSSIISSNASLGCKVVSNTLTSNVSSSPEGCYYNQSFGADQEVFVTIVNGSTLDTGLNQRVFFCLHDNPGTATVDGYALEIQKITGGSDHFELARMSNGSFGLTEIGAQVPVEFVDNDKVLVQHYSDGTMNVYRNSGTGWALAFTRNDATYDCTNSYLGIRPTVTDNFFDDFGGGNLTSSVNPTSISIMSYK